MNLHLSIPRTGGARGARWNPLNWLLGVDAAHRERHHLAGLGDSALRDIGMTTAEARRGFADTPAHWRHLS